MSNKSKKGYNGTPKAISRRKSALERLLVQLEEHKEIMKKSPDDRVRTDEDIKRIEKEVGVLKTRI